MSIFTPDRQSIPPTANVFVYNRELSTGLVGRLSKLLNSLHTITERGLTIYGESYYSRSAEAAYVLRLINLGSVAAPAGYVVFGISTEALACGYVHFH